MLTHRDALLWRSFRVVAVYANNDNKPGGLSKKFRLDPQGGELAPRLKAPTVPPEITEVLPLGPDSLRIGWTMDRRAFVAKDSVEGYFIYFKERDGSTNKITIMGSTSHSHIVDDLKAGTEYEIRIRAFNLAGKAYNRELKIILLMIQSNSYLGLVVFLYEFILFIWTKLHNLASTF